MALDLQKITAFYAEIDDDTLKNTAFKEMDSLDKSVQDIIVAEMEKRGLNLPLAKTDLVVNESKLNEYIAGLKHEQNLQAGILAGLAASIVGALLWAVITVTTGYQIGYMAIAIGFMVGYAIKTVGKGMDQIFGIIGAGLALFGCILGNFLSIIGFVAESEGYGYLETLSMIDFSVVPQIMIESFSPIDILFYGFALYQGYNFSFRQITEEEIIEHAVDK